MIKIYLQALGCVYIFLSSVTTVYSQSLSNQLVGTTGNFFKDASTSYTFSVGEMAVVSISSDSILVTQGFLQPTKSIVTSYESFEDQLKNDMHLFPNPGNGLLYVEFLTSINKYYQLEIYSLLGQQIINQNMNRSIVTIDVSSLAIGNYWIILRSATNEIVAKAPYKKM